MAWASWATVKLDDICTMKYGKMPKKSDLVDDGYPIFSGYRIVGFHKEYLYKEPEVVVVARGVGGTGDVKLSPPKAYVTNLSIVLQLKNKEVVKKFLYYLLGNENLRNLDSGSAQSQITITDLKNFQIHLPPTSAQHKATSILSAYDDLIENNLKRIKILEEIAQMIYREWFVNFRFPGHEKVKMVDSPLGKIPEGWEVKKLGDIVEINKRSIKKNNAPEDILYVDISSVTTGSINESTPYKFSDAPGRARRKVKHGDTIWSSVRPNRKSYALVIYPNPKTIVSTGFGVISPVSVPYTFLYEALTTDDFVGYLTNNARGAAYPAVNTEDYEKADILVPTDELMEHFHETVEYFYLLKNNMQQRNEYLRKTRDLLLPRLISGELDVEGLDIKCEEVCYG